MFLEKVQACGWPTLVSPKFVNSAFEAIDDSVSYTDVSYFLCVAGCVQKDVF